MPWRHHIKAVIEIQGKYEMYLLQKKSMKDFQHFLLLAAFSLTMTACGGGAESTSAADDGIASTVASAKIIAPGSQCPNGGIQVDSGIDENDNGLLDDSEIDSSEVLCNGIDGANGLGSLISMSDEQAGANCEFGGTRVDAGIDNNSNAVLDAVEVTDTRYLCALNSSDFDGLVYLSDFRAGGLLGGLKELNFAAKDGSSTRLLAAPASTWFSRSIQNYKISPDKSKVAFTGSLYKRNTVDLYVMSLLDNSAAIRVSAPFPGNTFDVVDDFVWSPDSRQLAYATTVPAKNIYDQHGLFTVFADGSGNANISHVFSGGTPDNHVIHSFKWNSFGDRIAYVAQWRGDVEQYALYTSDKYGNDHQMASLSLVGSAFNFDWNGDSLVYLNDQDTPNTNELYLNSPFIGHGKISGNLVAGGAVLDFKVAPTGEIAYRADQETDETIELYSYVNLVRTKVSANLVAGGDVTVYDWAFDGSRLAYIADQVVDEKMELYSVLPDGTVNNKISGNMIAEGDIEDFKWAPDSSRIAYTGDRETDGLIDLYSVYPYSFSPLLPDPFVNVKVSNVSLSGDVYAYDWAPDSGRLAYAADQDTINQVELYTVFVDASSNIKVSGSLPAEGDVLFAQDGQRFQWSPDGRQLAYLADQLLNDVIELFTVFADGTENIRVSSPMPLDNDVSEFAWE